MTARYPLLALLEIRRGEVERRERALAESIVRREEAEQEVEGSQHRVLQEKARTDAHQRDSFTSLAGGSMDVAGLALAEGHRRGLESSLLDALDTAEEARDLWETKRAAECAARRSLAAVRAEFEAVLSHQAEYEREQARRVDAQLEEEAADAHLARTMGAQARGVRS